MYTSVYLWLIVPYTYMQCNRWYVKPVQLAPPSLLAHATLQLENSLEDFTEAILT